MYQLLILQLRAIAEQFERFRIGQRLDIFDFAPMDDIAHGKLDDLARLGAWDIGDLNDARRHVARRTFDEDERPDPLRGRPVRRRSRRCSVWVRSLTM